MVQVANASIKHLRTSSSRECCGQAFLFLGYNNPQYRGNTRKTLIKIDLWSETNQLFLRNKNSKDEIQLLIFAVVSHCTYSYHSVIAVTTQYKEKNMKSISWNLTRTKDCSIYLIIFLKPKSLIRFFHGVLLPELNFVTVSALQKPTGNYQYNDSKRENEWVSKSVLVILHKGPCQDPDLANAYTFFYVRGCISYSIVAVTICHDQRPLKEQFILVSCYRRLDVNSVRGRNGSQDVK